MGQSGIIHIVTPMEPHATCANGGNLVTAARWDSMLQSLGWTVVHGSSWDGSSCDLLVALHARKSHDSVLHFRRAHPERPIVVVGTGTDLYSDIPDGGEVREALGLADRIVVLQPNAIDALPADLRSHARVIYQSVPSPTTKARHNPDLFEVAFLANVRPVKDPMTAVRAARLLGEMPGGKRIRIIHLGGIIDAGLQRELEAEGAGCATFVSVGELPHEEALDVIARSRLLLSTSRHEGGANVLSEALAYDTPILATSIPGSLGLLGDDYPGTFAVGDAEALAALLLRAYRDKDFYGRLHDACRAQAWVADPETELDSWRRLLGELTAS